MVSTHSHSIREFLQMYIAIKIRVDKLEDPIQARSWQPAGFRLCGSRIRQADRQCIGDQFAEEAAGWRSGFDVGLKRLHQPRDLWVAQIELRGEFQRLAVQAFLQAL